MKKIPQTITFQLFNRFSQVVYQSIQLNMRNKAKTSKTQNFILGEHPGNFHEKIPPTITFNGSTEFQYQHTYRFISTSGRIWKHRKSFKFHSRGAIGEFS